MLKITSDYVRTDISKDYWTEKVITTVRLFGIVISRKERVLLSRDTFLV